LARPAARIGLVGMGNPIQTLPIGDAALKEVNLIGVFRYVNQYPNAIEMIRNLEVNVKKLISSRYSLEQTKEAFEALREGRGLKIIVTH
jgi:L-iditol 2-dehydrogenase